MSPPVLAARARGLTWSVPGVIVAVGIGAWCAHALESQPIFDHYDRVPAVVLTGLLVSFLALSCLHTADEELDGATPRPRRTTVLGLVVGLVTLGAVSAALFVPLAPFERGGAELSRNQIGLGGLGLLGSALSCLHTADEELDGATPRPRRTTVLGLVVDLVTLGAVCAALFVPLAPFERGGAELSRNLIGLTGLGLLGGALGGQAAGWAVPFLWTAISYFGVTRDYDGHPGQSAWGWLMFPATWPATWVVAVGLLLAGLATYTWAGFPPRPTHHPLR